MEYSEIVAWYIAFLFSTTLHEAAHAWAAYRMGDNTAYLAGQVSLNPLPHIKREFFGTVIVPIASFFLGGWMIGWASTPYDPNWAYRYPKKSALMSIAGPASNLLILLVSVSLIHLGIALGYFYSPETIDISNVVAANNAGIPTILAKFLSIFFSLNLILFVFNLMPLPPLDGSGILPLLLSEEKGRKYMELVSKGGLAFFGIIIAWKLFGLIYWKFFLFAINLIYPESNYQ